MRRKSISIFTLVAFIIFSLSCYSTKTVRLDSDAAKMKEENKIRQVVLKSGEIIEFSKEQPGRIHNDSISGVAVRVPGKLDKVYIGEIAKDRKGQTLGTIISIPISAVEMITIKEKDSGKAVFFTIVLCACVLGVVFIGAGLNKGILTD